MTVALGILSGMFIGFLAYSIFVPSVMVDIWEGMKDIFLLRGVARPLVQTRKSLLRLYRRGYRRGYVAGRVREIRREQLRRQRILRDAGRRAEVRSDANAPARVSRTRMHP